MDKIKRIKLSVGKINITLIDPDPNTEKAWQGGSIKSDIKEICPYCKDIDCDMDNDCIEFAEHCTDRDIDCFNEKKAERIEFVRHRGAADAIESMVLAHAVAGIDVKSLAYIEGVETALNTLTNNY